MANVIQIYNLYALHFLIFDINAYEMTFSKIQINIAELIRSYLGGMIKVALFQTKNIYFYKRIKLKKSEESLKSCSLYSHLWFIVHWNIFIMGNDIFQLSKSMLPVHVARYTKGKIKLLKVTLGSLRKCFVRCDNNFAKLYRLLHLETFNYCKNFYLNI